jgi:hypothetical protein
MFTIEWITPNEDIGVKGIVICETQFKVETRFCNAETMNGFKEIGLLMMPEATRLSVLLGDTRFILKDGVGFNWEISTKKENSFFLQKD